MYLILFSILQYGTKTLVIPIIEAPAVYAATGSGCMMGHSNHLWGSPVFHMA